MVYRPNALRKPFQRAHVLGIDDLAAHFPSQRVRLEARNGARNAFGATGCDDHRARERLERDARDGEADAGRTADDEDGFVL